MRKTYIYLFFKSLPADTYTKQKTTLQLINQMHRSGPGCQSVHDDCQRFGHDLSGCGDHPADCIDRVYSSAGLGRSFLRIRPEHHDHSRQPALPLECGIGVDIAGGFVAGRESADGETGDGRLVFFRPHGAGFHGSNVDHNFLFDGVKDQCDSGGFDAGRG